MTDPLFCPIGDELPIGIATAFQRRDAAPFNQPLLPPQTAFGFEDRVRLISKQILQYQHMYPLAPSVAAFAQKTLSS